jgi:hypothetical protein
MHAISTRWYTILTVLAKIATYGNAAGNTRWRAVLGDGLKCCGLAYAALSLFNPSTIRNNVQWPQ